MLYILMTTGRCNLNCIYCGGSFPERLVPWRVEYDISVLDTLIEGDENPVIAFYGGEPLLNTDFIVEVMSRYDAKFVIQTNGIVYKRLQDEYWRRFDAVLLSIDGREEVTDYYRGRGVYKRVLEAAAQIRRAGFTGDLIARMTVSTVSDVYLDVLHLLSLRVFDHIHWQLDVVWSDRWRNFDDWSESLYIPGVSKLVRFWVEGLRNGIIYGIAPFQGIVKGMMKGGLQAPPCGAGTDSFTVTTDGRIIACPIAVDSKWAYLADLPAKPDDLLEKVGIGEPCTSCEYFKYCGGRCLYAHIERLWGDRGFRSVCKTVKSTIDSLRTHLDTIAQVIEEGIINKDFLLYPKYNNTVEIIP